MAGAEPIKLGSMLFTLVEPHRGHEVAYNRWYERDHFYAGCMIGPYQFAGKRFVATAELKALRDPDSSEVTGEPDRGQLPLGLYWVLDGYHDIWNRWAVDQVKALHKAGRMFNERDHVHTLLYRYAWEHPRDPDGLPAELALDHPSAGLVAVFTERADDLSTPADFETWHARGAPPRPSAGDLRPPGDRRRPSAIAHRRAGGRAPHGVRRPPPDDPVVPRQRSRQTPGTPPSARTGLPSRSSGRGRIVAALPFIPTIPGTDTYTDTLWTDYEEVVVSPDPASGHVAGRRFEGTTAIVTGAGSGHRTGHRHPTGRRRSVGGLPGRRGKTSRRDVEALAIARGQGRRLSL